MISKILIERFKNISRMELVLDKINILVGSNNSGKSSVLQAVQFFVSVAQTTGLEKNARWKDDRLSTSISPTQLVYTPLRDVVALAPGGRLKEDIRQAICITVEVQDLGSTNLIVRKGKNKNINVEFTGQALGEQIQSLENPFSIYVPGLAGIPIVEEYKNPGIVRRAAARGDANNVFRNVLWLLKNDSQRWEQFLRDLNKIFPEITLDLDFNPNSDEYIFAYLKKGNETLPIDAAGTGVLQAIQILSYINVYNPKVLILDEPDAHLHPNNQRKLAMLIKELVAERNLQVILSTHSRHLLDAFSGQSKLHWINNGSLVGYENTNEVSVLMDIGALDKGDLLKAGLIKCVVLTEDSDTEALERLLDASGFVMSETDIWPYNGCTKFDTAVVLANFIQKHAPGIKIIIHRDRDYYFDEEINEYIKKIREFRILLFLLQMGQMLNLTLLTRNILIHCILKFLLIELKELIELVVEESWDDLKSKIITGRSQIESLKAKVNNSKPPSAGEVAIYAERLLKSDIKRFGHGKTILRRLANKIQREIGGNINLVKPSPFVKCEYLNSVASLIWGKDE